MADVSTPVKDTTTSNISFTVITQSYLVQGAAILYTDQSSVSHYVSFPISEIIVLQGLNQFALNAINGQYTYNFMITDSQYGYDSQTCTNASIAMSNQSVAMSFKL